MGACIKPPRAPSVSQPPLGETHAVVSCDSNSGAWVNAQEPAQVLGIECVLVDIPIRCDIKNGVDITRDCGLCCLKDRASFAFSLIVGRDLCLCQIGVEKLGELLAGPVLEREFDLQRLPIRRRNGDGALVSEVLGRFQVQFDCHDVFAV